MCIGRIKFRANVLPVLVMVFRNHIYSKVVIFLDVIINCLLYNSRRRLDSHVYRCWMFMLDQMVCSMVVNNYDHGYLSIHLQLTHKLQERFLQLYLIVPQKRRKVLICMLLSLRDLSICSVYHLGLNI